MDFIKIRTWWASKQDLNGSSKISDLAQVLEKSGWARSVGGVGPYLTVFSRTGINREETDKAVKNLEIHELPSARGCTYILPAKDFALGLMVGRDFGNAEMKVALKLGVTEKEIEKLCETVLKALTKEAMGPDEIREATGKASRSLGEEGKKKGITTTLPLALGKLQVRGDIRRIPVNGRLDQQRYKYTLWNSNPLKKFSLSSEEAFIELAKKFFTWIGPATLAEFQWFSGLGVKTSKAATDALKLIPIEKGSDFFILENEMDAFQKFKIPKDPSYRLISSLDSIHALRRDAKSLLEDTDRKKVFPEGNKKLTAMFSDLESHAILDRGRIIGLWEFEEETSNIVYSSFVKANKELLSEISKTEKYIVEQLGDARSFSLDSPKSRKPRIDAIRKMK